MCKHCYFCFSQLGTAYVSATTGAVATALGLNALTKVTLILFPILTQILVCYEMSRFSPGSVSCCAQLPLWSYNYLWQLPSLVPDLIFALCRWFCIYFKCPVLAVFIHTLYPVKVPFCLFF